MKRAFLLIASLVTTCATLDANAATYSSPYGSSVVAAAVGQRNNTNNILLVFVRMSDNHCTVYTLSTTDVLVNTTVVGGPGNDSLYHAGDANGVSIYCSNGGVTYYLSAPGNPNNAIVTLKGGGGHDVLSCRSELGVCHAYGNGSNSSAVEHDWLESMASLNGPNSNFMAGEGGNDVINVTYPGTSVSAGAGDDCVDAPEQNSSVDGGTGTDRTVHWNNSYTTGFEWGGGKNCSSSPVELHPIHSEYCCGTVDEYPDGSKGGDDCRTRKGEDDTCPSEPGGPTLEVVDCDDTANATYIEQFNPIYQTLTCHKL